MALALDGSVQANATASTINVSLTTTQNNDIIVVMILTNGAPVLTVTGTGITFSGTARASAGTGGNKIEEWVGVAASPLSAVTITVTTTSSAFATVTAFGISGADTTTKFDSNGTLPGTATGGTITYSTSNANDFAVGAFRMASTGNPTQSGHTTIFGANFQAVMYDIFTSAQTGVGMGTIQGDSNGGIVDAFIQASAAAPLPPPTFTQSSEPQVRAVVLTY